MLLCRIHQMIIKFQRSYSWCDFNLETLSLILQLCILKPFAWWWLHSGSLMIWMPGTSGAPDVLVHTAKTSEPWGWNTTTFDSTVWLTLQRRGLLTCLCVCSILPMKLGVLLGHYLGAFNLMDTFKGRSQKTDWHLTQEPHVMQPVHLLIPLNPFIP